MKLPRFGFRENSTAVFTCVVLTMPANEYSDSDLFNKDHLEKVFWIEIAKRKAFRSDRALFTRFEALVQHIDEFCTAESGADGPMEAGAWQVLKAVENDGVFLTLWYLEEEGPVLFKALDRFHAEAAEVGELLKPHLEGFCLADFAVRADIGLLHQWWDYITSEKGKEELGTVDSHYSSFGEPRRIDNDDDDLPFPDASSAPTRRFSSFPCPVSPPLIVRRAQAWALATDEHDITVNGNCLEDQLVLVLDLTKPLPPMALLQAKLEMAQAAAQRRHTLRAFESGEFPDEKFASVVVSGSSGLITHLKAQADEHEIVRSTMNVNTMIYGLYAWDLIEGFRLDDELSALRNDALKPARKSASTQRNAEPGDLVLTEAEAYRITLKMLGGDMSEQEFEDAVRSVRRALTKIVRPMIERYEPARLPWADSSA